MSTVTVRQAKPEDFKRVQELNHQLFLSDARHFDDLDANWPKANAAMVSVQCLSMRYLTGQSKTVQRMLW